MSTLNSKLYKEKSLFQLCARGLASQNNDHPMYNYTVLLELALETVEAMRDQLFEQLDAFVDDVDQKSAMAFMFANFANSPVFQEQLGVCLAKLTVVKQALEAQQRGMISSLQAWQTLRDLSMPKIVIAAVFARLLCLTKVRDLQWVVDKETGESMLIESENLALLSDIRADVDEEFSIDLAYFALRKLSKYVNRYTQEQVVKSANIDPVASSDVPIELKVTRVSPSTSSNTQPHLIDVKPLALLYVAHPDTGSYYVARVDPGGNPHKVGVILEAITLHSDRAESIDDFRKRLVADLNIVELLRGNASRIRGTRVRQLCSIFSIRCGTVGGSKAPKAAKTPTELVDGLPTPDDVRSTFEAINLSPSHGNLLAALG